MNDHKLLVAKIVVIVVLLLVTLIFCFIPYVLNRWFKWTNRSQTNARDFLAVLCLLNFGGGVLIATTFIHILPAVVGTVDALQRCDMLVTTPFALPEILMCTGFYLMYSIEELMYFVVGQQQRRKRQALQLAEKAEMGVELTEEQQQQQEQEVAVVVVSEEEEEQPNWLRGLGIIVALSLHELFGGMSIGLEGSVGTVWFMCGAIAAHYGDNDGTHTLANRSYLPGCLLHCHAHWRGHWHCGQRVIQRE